jgi:hypothetical protein
MGPSKYFGIKYLFSFLHPYSKGDLGGGLALLARLTSCKTLYVCVKANSFAARIVFALNKIYRVRASAVVKEMKNVEISCHTNFR